MHTSQEVVYAKVGHDDCAERHNHKHMINHWFMQLRQRLWMQGGSIHHEGYERPHLLRVPTPVFAPRHVSPYSPYKDADAKCSHGRVEKEQRELLQRKHNVGGVVVEVAHDDGCQATYKGERQQGEAHHYDRHVDAEQGRVEHRHDVRYLWVHLRYMTDKQEETRHQEAACKQYAELETKRKRYQQHYPCHEKHRLVTVSHRQCAAYRPAQILAVAERDQGYKHHGTRQPSYEDVGMRVVAVARAAAAA